MENPQKNVVVVTGATGTGKSKLGVDLALALRPFVDCEIVSCDAMQVYKGLAIATNQITLEEQCGVPHHMIGCQDPLKAIDVVEFCKRAEQCIDQIYQRGHLPIIVGGTLYYLEVLLGLLVPQARSSPSVFVKGSNDNKMGDIVRDETTERDNYGNCSIASVDALTKLKDDEVSQILHAKSRKELVEWANKQKNTQLFALLERLDPVRARKLHPHDTRRIVNSLLTFVESGRAHSTQIRESVVQARLRYRVCVIALQCDRDTLEARLKHRIETMLQRGLINEIVTLRNRFLECQRELDFTDGILQSIGIHLSSLSHFASFSPSDTHSFSFSFSYFCWRTKGSKNSTHICNCATKRRRRETRQQRSVAKSSSKRHSPLSIVTHFTTHADRTDGCVIISRPDFKTFIFPFISSTPLSCCSGLNWWCFQHSVSYRSFLVVASSSGRTYWNQTKGRVWTSGRNMCVRAVVVGF
jgi:tRNA A37 N6-isopentenylltransferase MiaA